jgi:hypothetical protein
VRLQKDVNLEEVESRLLQNLNHDKVFQLTFAVGSSADSLIGIGTLSMSFCNSSFSSSLIEMCLNSPESENTRKSSISLCKVNASFEKEYSQQQKRNCLPDLA